MSSAKAVVSIAFSAGSSPTGAGAGAGSGAGTDILRYAHAHLTKKAPPAPARRTRHGATRTAPRKHATHAHTCAMALSYHPSTDDTARALNDAAQAAHDAVPRLSVAQIRAAVEARAAQLGVVAPAYLVPMVLCGGDSGHRHPSYLWEVTSLEPRTLRLVRPPVGDAINNHPTDALLFPSLQSCARIIRRKVNLLSNAAPISEESQFMDLNWGGYKKGKKKVTLGTRFFPCPSEMIWIRAQTRIHTGDQRVKGYNLRHKYVVVKDNDIRDDMFVRLTAACGVPAYDGVYAPIGWAFEPPIYAPPPAAAPPPPPPPVVPDDTHFPACSSCLNRLTEDEDTFWADECDRKGDPQCNDCRDAGDTDAANGIIALINNLDLEEIIWVKNRITMLYD